MGKNFNAKHLEIAKILVARIKCKEIITYTELSTIVGIGIEKNSSLYGYLGDLSSYSFDNDMPLISVTVVHKSDNKPGDGFYRLYKEKVGIKENKNLNKKDKDKIFIDELNKVFEYDNWDRLIILLE